ncbi:MAG TPA: zf-HC2 domain-containing protein [Steroidobacteraceae bacterium]
MMPSRASPHEESWLLLPWLANGRLSHAERAGVEEHLRECAACTRELERQRLMCQLLTEPDRVTYAPGPSLRKLMARIDGHALAAPREVRTATRRSAPSALAAAWRPPGLAWAASLVLAIGVAALATTAYRWSQPSYHTYSVDVPATPGVLHVAFDRSLPIGEMEDLLRSAGARVVEGPGTTGVFGIAPVSPTSHEMQALAARLRTDARVRWVQPLTEGAGPEGAQGRRTRGP